MNGQRRTMVCPKRGDGGTHSAVEARRPERVETFHDAVIARIHGVAKCVCGEVLVDERSGR